MSLRQTVTFFFFPMLLMISGIGLGMPKAYGFISDDGQIIAAFLYNLTDSWRDRSTITICSYGHDEVSESLKNSYEAVQDKKGSATKTIQFIDRIELAQSQQCNILYISRYEENLVPTILEQTQSFPILTVSTIEHFVDLGGMMEIKVFRQKLKLRLDKAALKKAGIQLSPVILMSINPG